MTDGQIKIWRQQRDEQAERERQHDHDLWLRFLRNEITRQQLLGRCYDKAHYRKVSAGVERKRELEAMKKQRRRRKKHDDNEPPF